MATFEKAFWSINGDNISLSMPIQKVNQEKRIVSGWATTDSLDKQGDIVDISASERAFENFRGNIREMHQPVAVGKIVSFKRDTYFDKATGEMKNGIFVDVYVSKGAEDTWLKVTEGILTAFSIGGSIKEAEQIYQKGMDKPVRFVKQYDLTELSLVDNPANDDANFVSIQKVNSSEQMEKNYLENVYWCSTNDTVIVSEKSDYSCPQCDTRMTNIGFVESTDAQKAETIAALLESLNKSDNDVEAQVSDATSDDKAIDGIAKSIANENEKEGNNMGFLNRKTTVVEEYVAKSEDADTVVVVDEVVEEVVEKSADEAVEAAEEEAAVEEEVVEKSETVEQSEDAADEETVEKTITPADSNEDLAKNDEINASVADAMSELVATVKSLAEQVADLSKSVAADIASVKGEVEKFGERIDSVEADTAVRKSGELGGFVQENRVQKSKWDGRFLNSADLYR